MEELGSVSLAYLKVVMQGGDGEDLPLSHGATGHLCVT